MAALNWRGALTHPLFAGIREDRAYAVLSELVYRPVRAGGLLNSPGATPACLHLVLAGRLRVYRLDSGGHQLLLEIIEAGGIDGILGLSAQSGHFTQALTDSLVVSITPQQLQLLSEAEPRIGQALLTHFAAWLGALEERMESTAVQAARALRAADSSLSDGEAVVPFPHESGALAERVDRDVTCLSGRPISVESRTIEHLRWKVHGEHGGFRATPREREILGLLATGQTDKEVGARLRISPRTVQMHLRNLCRRNLVRNRAEATALWTTAQCDPAMTPLPTIRESWAEVSAPRGIGQLPHGEKFASRRT